MNKKQLILVWIILLGLFGLSGCAPSNEFIHTYDSYGNIAGFWFGLWHGLVAPIALIASLFMDIGVYAVHNTGFGYNCGFVLGLLCLGGGAVASQRSDD